VDIVHPQTITHVHNSDVAGTMKHPVSTLPVNQEDFHGVQEISINYTSSGELYDRKNTVVNSCFS
jgi:predicted RNA methylase